MVWLVLAFISAAMLGFYDASKKYSLRNNAVIPILFLNTLFCALLLAPLIIFSYTGHIHESAPFHVGHITAAQHRLIIIKSAIVLSSWILGYFAIKHLPLTIAGPINATRPVMTIVGALLIFGETLNAWQWAGVILGAISFFMMSRSSSKEGIRFSHNLWIYLIIGAAILGTVSGLYDKYLMSPPETGGAGVDRMAVQGWYNIYQCLMMGAALLIVWWPRRHRTTPFRWTPAIVLISIFLSVADFVYFYALTFPDAMISVVSMVRRGSVLVSFVIGALIFNEKNLRSKAVDLVFVLLSMICLWIGTKG